ncbi:MAG TPA: hypothetical protein VGD67_15530, partial [Pseudonocardiaceae bacterium]
DGLVALLRALPPSRREELYEAAVAGTGAERAELGEPLLDVLPRERRVREARRMLGLPHLGEDERARLRLTAYLPLGEAAPVLAEVTRRTDAEERALGYELLLGCAARTGDAGAVTTTVRGLTRLSNEQDPVRSRVLSALGRLPARLLRPELVPELDRFVTDAVQARDSSHATRTALRTLAVTVIQLRVDSPELVGWAFGALRRLFGHRTPWLGRLDRTLRRGQEHELFAVVRERLEADAARGELDPVFAVTRALGRRAWGVPRLQALLGGAVATRSTASTFREATELWLADPGRRGARVAEVLRVDASAVTLHPVWAVLCANRTDLLPVALGRRAPAGRFITKGVRWIPLDPLFVERWPTATRQSYAELLAALAADGSLAVHQRVRAIHAAARVPEFGATVVRRYLPVAAAVDPADQVDPADPAVPFAEAALAALAWTDRPAEALPELLRHAGSDRARVAVYTLARVCRFVAPSALTEPIGWLATGAAKVTSRKEGLRLVTRLAVPDAAGITLAAWRRAGEHRDVRVAAVAAARLRLDDPRAWQVLREAAVDGEREFTLAVIPGHPHRVAERHRRLVAAVLPGLCRSGDQVVARAAWAAMPAWAPWIGGVGRPGAGDAGTGGTGGGDAGRDDGRTGGTGDRDGRDGTDGAGAAGAGGPNGAGVPVDAAGLVAGAVADLSDLVVWRTALTAAVALLGAGSTSVLPTVVEALCAALPQAPPERDLPA